MSPTEHTPQDEERLEEILAQTAVIRAEEDEAARVRTLRRLGITRG